MISVGGSQFVLAITSDHLLEGKPLAVYPPEHFKPSLLDNANVYFTHIDKSSSQIKGYKLGSDLVAVPVWTLNLDKKGEKIIGLETQF